MEYYKTYKTYYLYKTWVSSNYEFVSQLQQINSEDKSKYFLVCDLKLESFGIKFLEKKPLDLYSNHAVVNIMRKYLPSRSIISVFQDDIKENIWIIVFINQIPHFYIHCIKKNVGYLEFLDSLGYSLVRYGPLGTYTNKIKYDPTIIPQFFNNDTLKCLDLSLLTCNKSSVSKFIIPTIQKELIKKLKRKQKTLLKSIIKTRNNIPNIEDIKYIEMKAKYLQQYCFLAKDGDKQLILNSDLTNLSDGLVIELKSQLSIGENINYYFKQFKKLKKSFEINSSFLFKAQQQLDEIYQDVKLLSSVIVDDEQIENICKKYSLNLSSKYIKINNIIQKTKLKKLSQKSCSYKIFKYQNEAMIYVGKDAYSNDILTKQAYDNDYWLHVVGDSGAHVIVKWSNNFKEGLPKDLLQQAAILAVHFSRFKKQKAADVYLVQKKYLKKIKGSAHGVWNILKADVIFVQYEDDEIQKILANEIKI